MVVDKEEHKQLILELIKQSQIPGHLVELVYEVKKSVESASVSAK